MSEQSNGGARVEVGEAQKAPDLEKKLRALFGGRTSLPVGRFQFLNLEPIKAEFGERWPKVAERAAAICKQVITQHLTRSDLYFAVDELAFLMLFGSFSEQEAEVKCGLIGSEISRHLLGENAGLNSFEIQTVMVDAGTLEGGLDGALHDIIRQVDSSVERKVAQEAKTAPETPILSARATDEQWRQLPFIYRPVWNVKQNALSTYICVPRLDRGPALGRVMGYRILGDVPGPDSVAALDRESFRRIKSVLDDLERRDQKLLISCPVGYETLRSTRRLLAYLEQLGALTDYQRKLLVFEVAGLPEDVPQPRLLELLAPLAPFSRARTVRVAIDRRRFDMLDGLRIHSVATDLSEAVRPDRELFSLFNRFVEAASAAGLRSCVHGLSKLSLASAAVCAGFDYVDGDAVTSVTETPDNVYRFQSQDLFRTLGV